MKKALSLFLCIAMLLTSTGVCLAAGDAILISPAPVKKTVLFAGDSARDAIKTFGNSNKSANATRGDVANLLWEISGRPYVNYFINYTDIAENDPNTETLRWTAAEKILLGYGNGLSGAKDPITFEQLATVLYRFSTNLLNDDTSKVSENVNTLSYDDIFEVDEYATPAVHWALAAHVLNPPAGKVLPHQAVTREQVATIVSNFISAPKTLKDPAFKISENLPEFRMDGTYTRTSDDYERDCEVLWTFKGTADSEYDYVREYRWKDTGKTVKQEAQIDAQKYYADQEINIFTSNYFHEEMDTEYAYYVAYNSSVGKYIQEWYFKDNGYIYQVETSIGTTDYVIPGTDIVIAVPKSSTQSKKPDQGSVASFKSNNTAFPDIFIYIDPLDFKFTKENFENLWGIKDVKISKKTYSATSNLTLPGYYLTYTFESDGVKQDCRMYTIKRAEHYLSFGLTQNADSLYAPFTEMSARAIVTSAHMETLTDPEMKISENLPAFKMAGTYTRTSPYDPDVTSSEILWAYKGTEDSEYSFVREFKWEDRGKTLIQEAEYDFERFYPGKEIYTMESNYWDEEGDCEYVYYMVYDEDTHEYSQNWLFKDGAYVYQIEAYIPAKDYTIEETGTVIAIPKYCEPVNEGWWMLDNAIVGFKSDYLAFPNFTVYRDSLNTKFTNANLKALWDVDSIKVSPKAYNGGNDEKIEGYHTTYSGKTSDGTKYEGSVYSMKKKDFYVGIDFVYNAGAFGNAYTEVAERAIVTSAHSK